MYAAEYTPWRRDAYLYPQPRMPEALNSWDSCMDRKYCKWPVIAAIIVGGLLVLWVAWIIFSCICCATRVCCCCTSCVRSCFSCCWCCGGSDGDKDRNKNNNDADQDEYMAKYGGQPQPLVTAQPPPMPTPAYYAPPVPPPQPPMMMAPHHPQLMQQPPHSSDSQTHPLLPPQQQHYQPAYPVAAVHQLPPEPTYPQVATFETPRKASATHENGEKPWNPDSLPHMPAWSDAKTRYVEEVDEVEAENEHEHGRELDYQQQQPQHQQEQLAVEMDTLPPAAAPAPLRQATPVGKRLASAATGVPPSPRSMHSDSPVAVPRGGSPAYGHGQDAAQKHPDQSVWHNDGVFGVQDSRRYSPSPASTHTPSPHHQQQQQRVPSYTHPRTAPYPHSVVGDGDDYHLDMPSPETMPGYIPPQAAQGTNAHEFDHWRHSPLPQQQQHHQQQQHQHQQRYPSSSQYAYDQQPGAAMLGDAPSSAPGKRLTSAAAQRQSSELGF
ncbi:hypothetical protein KEM52_001089 [Ascosphaera acerosa]|nr:hypothetical protein KEM52_001089 [Ascosphaera acerosa]